MSARLQRDPCLRLLRGLGTILLVSSLFLPDSNVCAQESARRIWESSINERIDFIQRSFDVNKVRARVWSYGWIGIDAAGSLQAIPAIFSGYQRTSNIVAASESLLGLAVQLIYPFHAKTSARDLRKLPEDTAGQLEFKLKKAEDWLERDYRQEQFGRSWINHVGAFAVGMIGGGIIWRNDGPQNGIANALVCIVMGELQIWTQPTQGITDYNNYHRKYKNSHSGISGARFSIAPSQNGIVAELRF